MFERFTDEARNVVVLAQEEARGLRHSWIGTEHLLLGLLRERDGIAAGTLASLSVTLEDARAKVVAIVGAGGEVPSGQIPFTRRAKKVLELSLREALALGHNYIGPEHVLLGLVRENDGPTARILLDFDADPEKIRSEVIHELSDPEARRRAQAAISADRVRALVPFVHVADVERSIEFYGHLGFEIADRRLTNGRPTWASLRSGRAQLMVALASAPIRPDQQAVLLYLYTRDLAALRERLVGDGVAAGEIAHPDHMPDGELRLTDPDGYVLLVGQPREP